MAATDIAIVGWSQTKLVSRAVLSEPQLCLQAITAAIASSGVNLRDIGFTCSGSCDYLSGGPFVFVANLEAAGAWPPIAESHVEMDGAWALYEAWVRLHEGDIDTALVFGSGKSSPSNGAELYPQQLDPYYLAPLGLDPNSMAGMQARILLDSGRTTERDFAEVASRNLHNAKSNPNAVVSGDFDIDDLLAGEYVSAPLRAHDLPPVTDGAAAVVLATADRARSLTDHPVYIRGIDHRIEQHQLGMRDLASSSSTTLAAAKAGLGSGPVELAELAAPYGPQELIVRQALGLGDDVTVNPSGGCLAANPVMASGLIRIIEAASRVAEGGVHRALAHATAGQCLQQNLVCILEGE
ncbi:MAG TPA: lipid-transfer protein [Acidimicrobiales bacterium]|jgi:acetyl-CoA acetyltransferase